MRGHPSARKAEEKAKEEMGYSELRTTEAKIISDYPFFKDGCPQCGEKPVVTMIIYFDLAEKQIRSCRCRVCSWRGKLRG